MKDIKDPYSELAFAVCIEAVDSYRRARRFVDNDHVKHYKNHDAGKRVLRDHLNELRDTEAFFKSPVFELYSGLDGNKVFEKLKAECDGGYYGSRQFRFL